MIDFEYVTAERCLTSFLFGIPGEGVSAATIIDGYPMAKKGAAGRALGAVLMSSLVGAVVRAFCLALAIPVVRPLVLAFGSAGGGLIPTVAFGIPSGPSMAILTGALLLLGIIPGPGMLTKHLSLTFLFVRLLNLPFLEGWIQKWLRIIWI